MRYAQIRKYDVANGSGIRVSLFVSGCTLGCKNCFNKAYQDFAFGKELDESAIELLTEYLSCDTIKGLSVLGGEPMDNARELGDIIYKIRQKVDKGIWIYSGYTLEQILKDEWKKKLLMLCDVLVDGRFVEELKDLRLRFRGSSNQRIIDIQESIRHDKVVLWME
ncbi:MAG: anaerobic ribonucleoside-triphosphate reductase activating protein [Peptostreptococcaceae bacterium]|nr:anaerobic ribonucleoside-triphosphate reductase activating protein [Peptostreptococcaceae bacterium]